MTLANLPFPFFLQGNEAPRGSLTVATSAQITMHLRYNASPSCFCYISSVVWCTMPAADETVRTSGPESQVRCSRPADLLICMPNMPSKLLLCKFYGRSVSPVVAAVLLARSQLALQGQTSGCLLDPAGSRLPRRHHGGLWAPCPES